MNRCGGPYNHHFVAVYVDKNLEDLNIRLEETSYNKRTELWKNVVHFKPISSIECDECKSVMFIKVDKLMALLCLLKIIPSNLLKII